VITRSQAKKDNRKPTLKVANEMEDLSITREVLAQFQEEDRTLKKF